jgi:hypothetical protein
MINVVRREQLEHEIHLVASFVEEERQQAEAAAAAALVTPVLPATEE